MSEVQVNSIARSQDSTLAVNKVLRNTYLLLSMTLAFSALCAVATTMMQVSSTAYWAMIIGGFISLFIAQATSRSAMGLVWVFVFTGLWGGSLGPLLNFYLTSLSNGPALIAQALGGTAIMFLSLSGYVLMTGKNFSYLSGFLFTGMISVIVIMLLNIFFFQMPALSLAMSAAIVLLMSGYILFETSQIINGGQRNYILATISLYLSIYNLFVSLLHLLGALSGRE